VRRQQVDGVRTALDRLARALHGDPRGVVRHRDDRPNPRQRRGPLQQQVDQAAALGVGQLVELRREAGEHHAAHARSQGLVDHPYEALLVHRAVLGERRLEDRADA
jgi:hypothetical protein